MTMPAIELNRRAAALCEEIARATGKLGVARSVTDSGTTLFDFGIHAQGSLEAAILLARVCLADLATVTLGDCKPTLGPWPLVKIATNQPVMACMASQYAGWEVKGEIFSAMGSGPMRAAAGREPLFDDIGNREQADACVGVLECDRLPPDAVCCNIAEKCGISPEQLTLLVAPTSSIAGTLQVVARSVESVMHKLYELGFDLQRIVKGVGQAPLCPVVDDNLIAIGQTNDAILYGGSVALEVTGDDESIRAIGPRVPSSASSDYGKPFAQVLANYNNDFYRVDPLLFSTAKVKFLNIDTGNQFSFGELNAELLNQSFGND